MKYQLSVLFMLCFFCLNAQSNTEVYLCNLESVYGGIDIFNIQNISNDPGYDSQPSFSDNNTVLFAGNHNGQTDIAQYSISEKSKTWFHLPTDGGEYSPTHIPNGKNNVAAVRLDPDGLQRLYYYKKDSPNSSEVIEGLQVAYFAYYDDQTLLASVLGGEDLDLVLCNLKTKTVDTLLTNSGRSIHKVLGSKSMSYTIINKEKNEDLYLFDVDSGESFFVCQLPIGVQDYTWLNSSQILIGSGSKIYMYDTFLSSEWKLVADLSGAGFKNISRMAVSPDEKKIALVAEPVQK
ncbi:TolB family protein [Ulvibacter antarcticus]|uniref:WD40 repeat protein n=1 Tax=Ulvibacter antarcticus TaxID=442714 RepID=A0A3L9YVY4_9FLAO|nr:hypothetical protein [Ulvibacter antarcticus]RMA64673.1 hypothetical protein BXY75_1552 [Ulvibacter antarcticus]